MLSTLENRHRKCQGTAVSSGKLVGIGGGLAELWAGAGEPGNKGIDERDDCKVPTNTYRHSRLRGNPGSTWPGKRPFPSQLHHFAIVMTVTQGNRVIKPGSSFTRNSRAHPSFPRRRESRNLGQGPICRCKTVCIASFSGTIGGFRRFRLI